MKQRPLHVPRRLVLSSLMLLLAVGRATADNQTLTGHVPAAIHNLNLQPTGRLAADQQLHMSIALPLHNRDALIGLVQQIYNPSGTNYHRYLTTQQFTEQFGPTVQEYQAVQDFVRSNRLTLDETFSNRALVAVSGNVADIEAAFHITLRTYRHPTENREFYAPDVEPTVDTNLRISRINGLDNYFLPRPGNLGTRPAGSAPGGGTGPDGYWGYDFRNAYVPNASSLTGSGQVVGLFELDGYYPSDITTYENDTGLPNLVPTLIKVGSFNGQPSTNFNRVGEVSLDIEAEISMAPGMSSLRVYEGNDTASILTRIASDNLAKQISSSWFFGDASTNDTELLEMAAQGQSFFNCSGDNLAYVNNVANGPNSGDPWDDPYLVSVGGTELITTSTQGWLQETNWNLENRTNGSGGGVSVNYAMPLWQQGVNVSAVGGSTGGRNSPDVAMVADNCTFISNNGSVNGWWGTSIAAPLWAGFTALVNQEAALEGKPTVGFLNPAIYAIGESGEYNSCFHDITIGNNTWTASPSHFFCASGYDLCTGWGSPNGINLIYALADYGGPIYVNFNYSGFIQVGQYNFPFSTMAQAIKAVSYNGTIFIETAGSSSETLTISNPVTITSMNGGATIGN